MECNEVTLLLPLFILEFVIYYKLIFLKILGKAESVLISIGNEVTLSLPQYIFIPPLRNILNS